jgi:Xaa-Pro aminopeptidase
VHEGPQRIATFGGGDEPLQAGMILSNEPGYYKTGEYGIRIENLILTVPLEIEGAEKEMFGFETLTFAPYERVLIDVSMLDSGEIAWIDAYHARVREIVGPQLTGEAADWLQKATVPLLESA